MRRGQVTHILTAELIPLPHVVTSHFPHMAVLHVAIADLPGSDLLGELESCVKFIRYVFAVLVNSAFDTVRS